MYATVNDMEKLFGKDELTQLVPSEASEESDYSHELVQKALDNAEAEANAYLANRYALPLRPIPSIMLRLTCDIARYQLFGVSLTEEVEKRYKNAISFLKNVSNGTASIGSDSEGNSLRESGSVSGFGCKRAFSAQSLRDYAYD